MRKKTAPLPQEHRDASSSRHPGLIAKGKNNKQSATDKCALDNRSHRTPVSRAGLRVRFRASANRLKVSTGPALRDLALR